MDGFASCPYSINIYSYINILKYLYIYYIYDIYSYIYIFIYIHIWEHRLVKGDGWTRRLNESLQRDGKTHRGERCRRRTVVLEPGGWVAGYCTRCIRLSALFDEYNRRPTQIHHPRINKKYTNYTKYTKYELCNLYII